MEFLHSLPTHRQTKKIKNKQPSSNLSEVWKMLEEEEELNKLKCVYEKSDISTTNSCDECKSTLFTDDHGFMFCSNKKES